MTGLSGVTLRVFLRHSLVPRPVAGAASFVLCSLYWVLHPAPCRVHIPPLTSQPGCALRLLDVRACGVTARGGLALAAVLQATNTLEVMTQLSDSLSLLLFHWRTLSLPSSLFGLSAHPPLLFSAS